MNRLFAVLGVVALMLSSACTTESGESAAGAPAQDQAADLGGQSAIPDDLSQRNILQVAISSADHSTLVAGVQAAELENVLANNGPFTVFAPNNAAFDALPDGVLDDLLKPENKETLKHIITYHAAPGTYQGDLLSDGLRLFQATGHYVNITREGDDVFVEGAKILGTVAASNGVIHVIDKVLLPPEG